MVMTQASSEQNQDRDPPDRRIDLEFFGGQQRAVRQAAARTAREVGCTTGRCPVLLVERRRSSVLPEASLASYKAIVTVLLSV